MKRYNFSHIEGMWKLVEEKIKYKVKYYKRDASSTFL